MNRDERLARHVAHACTPLGGEKVAYMREHDLKSQEVWQYGQCHKDIGQTRATKKKVRTRVLASQGECCTLCGRSNAGGKRIRWCLNESGKVACNGCNIFLTQYRKLRAEGVTCEDMEAASGGTE